MPILNDPQLFDWFCSKSKFNGIDKIVWSAAYDRKYIDECLGKGDIAYFRNGNTYDGIKNLVQQAVAYCNYHPEFEYTLPQT